MRTTYLFILLVIAVSSVFIYGLAGARPKANLWEIRKHHWLAVALGLLALWLGPSGWLAATGRLDRYTPMPPPALVVVALTTVATVLLAFSPIGTRLATGISLAGLVGFQAFRIPLEWLLHRLFREGVIPVQMTYSGSNFDIVSGVTAVILCALLASGSKSRALVLAWNTLALGLLTIIVSIAVLSTPSPLRIFPIDPPNTLLSKFPYIWLATFFVQAALFGHLLVFRAVHRLRGDES